MNGFQIAPYSTLYFHDFFFSCSFLDFHRITSLRKTGPLVKFASLIWTSDLLHAGFYFIFFKFKFFYGEIEGRQASAKAQEAIDHLANFSVMQRGDFTCQFFLGLVTYAFYCQEVAQLTTVVF